MTGLATLRQISLTRKRLFYKYNFFYILGFELFFNNYCLIKNLLLQCLGLRDGPLTKLNVYLLALF